MNDLTYIKNGIELDIMDLATIIGEKSSVSTKKQSRKKLPNQICELFKKVTDVFRLMVNFSN